MLDTYPFGFDIINCWRPLSNIYFRFVIFWCQLFLYLPYSPFGCLRGKQNPSQKKPSKKDGHFRLNKNKFLLTLC